MNKLLEDFNEGMAAAVRDVQRSLVIITNGHRGQGAGTIWHAEGLILTNAHVIGRGAPQITLEDGRTFPARVLARDKQLDLAALSIEAEDLPTIEPGLSKSLRAGEWVMAIGHPWGVAGAVTAGTVIGVGQSLYAPGGNQQEWVAVSLHMRPGHSGGPLIDAQRRLIGINTMISGPDVGFAVPVHVVKQFLRERLGSRERVM